MYRFKGIYELDLEATNFENGFVWRRTATRAKTYSQQYNSTSKKNMSVSNEETFVEGINYVTNEKGERIAVMIGLKEHGQLWEALYNTLISKDTNSKTLV